MAKEILSRGVTRRAVLGGMAGVAALSIAGRVSAAGGEAPALAQLAKDGKLPPLAERLPEKPLVVKPFEKVGTYGGTLRRGLRGSADHNGILRMVGNQGLVRWNLDFTEVLPNVAERWEVNDERDTNSPSICRKGMKWSDGKPFTADDVVFSIEDCAKNTELYKSPPAQLVDRRQAGDRREDRRDDRQVHLRRAPMRCSWSRPGDAARPASDAVRQALLQPVPSRNTIPNVGRSREGRRTCRTGRTLFRSQLRRHRDPVALGQCRQADARSLGDHASPMPAARRASSMKRNPYFWQVDTEGNQLPYIDRDQLRHLAGRRIADARRRSPARSTSRSATSTRCRTSRRCRRTRRRAATGWSSSMPRSSQQCQIYFNITHKDPKMREMFANKDFRQALSLGINRKEIIDLVYLGQSRALPGRAAPGPSLVSREIRAPVHRTRRRQGERHPRRARLQEGRRRASACGPTARRCSSPIDVIPTLYPDLVDALELVKRALGRDRRRHEGQHDRARALLHARRQQRP